MTITQSQQEPQTATTEKSGRQFHTTTSAYWLPSDEEEMDRLTGQHFALKGLFAGNLSRFMLDEQHHLKPGTRVLDIGCGPGTWPLEVATDFPSAEVVGVDIVDIFPKTHPTNTTFELGNVVDGLAYPDNSFDVVNMRFFLLALRKEEWPKAYAEAQRLLKPGGYLQVWECTPLVYGRDFVSNVGKNVAKFMEAHGQHPFVVDYLHGLLEAAGFDVIDLDKRMVDLGERGPLNRACLWNVVDVVKSTQPFMASLLGYETDEAYTAFTHQFAIECQMDPHAYWKVARAVALKR
ncbi:S-adenosyl-L-methionine-dependent methyltransferase [Hesseltinella vesiculosa]|uniref:S-adenosyl-L-methionine-dependent methyltransferase n=1 Tax=Hesseltinella vesiculosa TaxID=101127 RepID=A0A1X2GPK0_9FUNG|nr:S-adenosyl-L-methionine-dependent methyltransferase [Hesseltinella vesiculosa]